jgi:hypothetical protein
MKLHRLQLLCAVSIGLAFAASSPTPNRNPGGRFAWRSSRARARADRSSWHHSQRRVEGADRRPYSRRTRTRVPHVPRRRHAPSSRQRHRNDGNCRLQPLLRLRLARSPNRATCAAPPRTHRPGRHHKSAGIRQRRFASRTCPRPQARATDHSAASTDAERPGSGSAAAEAPPSHCSNEAGSGPVDRPRLPRDRR